MTHTAPFGSWRSPIEAATLVRGARALVEAIPDGDAVWWAEARPDEGGRVAIVRRDGEGKVTEVTPPDANVRSRVHEYGGGAWWVAGGVLYYVEVADQQLRRLVPGGRPQLLTEGSDRYADHRVTPDGRWLVTVRERHQQAGGGQEVVNAVVAVRTDGSGEVRVLVAGADFYSDPRPSPDGRSLAWLQWDHPNMPWDGTELWVGALGDGVLGESRRLSGGVDEWIAQPRWAGDGHIRYMSDETGWSNRYLVSVAAGEDPEPEVVGEFELAGPPWIFGTSTHTATGDGTVAQVVARQNTDELRLGATVVDRYSAITSLRADADQVTFIGAGHGAEPELVRIDAAGGRAGDLEVVRPGRDLGLDRALLAPPEHLVYPTADGDEAHAWFYPPANPAHRAPADELPPLLVVAHGGPTGCARNELQLGLRYWTSRGFAVADVDYRGSTGYGRAYRNALRGRWGVADVDDCVAVANHLAAEGRVDPDRLAIRGQSAGGYTVLCALAFHDVFAAGAVRYGVADLEALAAETHKFESRYLDRLVGPYPDDRETYVARSPIHHIDRLAAPMIILQGLEDEVVPPNQAEMVVDALRAKGLPVAYLTFPDEGHGFRNGPNIVRALEAELSFFGQVFGFDPADDIDPVPIDNLTR